MLKEFHLWIGHGYPSDTCLTYTDTLHKIRDDKDDTVLHTTQIHFLDTELFARNYRVYVHINAHTCKEIKLGDSTTTGRLIHSEHNLEKLLLIGEFGDIYHIKQEDNV